MIENAHVETASFIWLIVGAVLWIAVPVAIAIIWKLKKKEPITSILVGAATFLLFALILEKPIQNVLAFPTAMGLPEHTVSRFLNANPVLLALVAGLFPGVFEETGRLIAFKTVLRKRKNKETSISYGIGHGGFEVILILGLTYIQYIAYAVMLNTGTFGTVVDQVVSQAPEQLGSIESVVSLLTGFSFADLSIAFVERIFAVLFHIGASIFVFYACKDKKRFWLYPFAIILHTGMDFIGALSIFNVINLSAWTLEGIVAVFGLLTFFGAYLLLYRKLYENYISGMALAKAASAAGIETYHGTAKRLMENRHYLGDDFYPAIIDQETFDEAAAIRLERAGKLGRLNRKKNSKPAASPTSFRMAVAEQHYEDPRLQAEYIYSLIESEVS